jgi:hypothetical protein
MCCVQLPALAYFTVPSQNVLVGNEENGKTFRKDNVMVCKLHVYKDLQSAELI